MCFFNDFSAALPRIHLASVWTVCYFQTDLFKIFICKIFTLVVNLLIKSTPFVKHMGGFSIIYSVCKNGQCCAYGSPIANKMVTFTSIAIRDLCWWRDVSTCSYWWPDIVDFCRKLCDEMRDVKFHWCKMYLVYKNTHDVSFGKSLWCFVNVLDSIGIKIRL